MFKGLHCISGLQPLNCDITKRKEKLKKYTELMLTKYHSWSEYFKQLNLTA